MSDETICGVTVTDDQQDDDVTQQQQQQEKDNKKNKKKRQAEERSSVNKTSTQAPPAKKARKEVDDEFAMNVPFKIIDGVRHLAPYWAVYRTRTKGRWIGRKMVDCFSQEFLSTNKHYAKIACKLGRIRVNGVQMTDVDYVLKNGDSIEHTGHRHEHPVKDYPITIIHEDDNLLVVNKPPSFPVHTCGQYSVHTILGQLRVHQGRTGLRVLHRLDRTTSGVLLFAKNYETDLEFKSTLKQGEWSKEYICRVDGVFPDHDVICEAPIGNLVVSMGIQCVREDGKTAKSTFRRIWTDGKTSVCSVSIETGRTHQIRVHAQYLGYPIVGDQLYNKDVWGPQKGKDGVYGKETVQLAKDVQDSHKSQQWHESVDPEYERRMENMANDENLQPEPDTLERSERPEYDPICLNCNVIKKQVPPDHFRLFLHCLRYQTSKWSFQTDLPDWAIEPCKEDNKQ